MDSILFEGSARVAHHLVVLIAVPGLALFALRASRSNGPGVTICSNVADNAIWTAGTGLASESLGSVLALGALRALVACRALGSILSVNSSGSSFAC